MKLISKTFFAISTIGLLSTVPASAQEQGNVTTSGWFKTCTEQGENKLCNVQFRVVTKQGNQLITSMNLIDISGKVNRKVFRIIVPTGRSLPEGIQIQVDGKRSVVIPFTYCRPQICAAEVQLNDDLVKVFKAGGGLIVTSINFQKKQNPVPVTLKGFTSAFDGPPVKQEAPGTREDKIKQQLQDKLEQQQGTAN